MPTPEALDLEGLAINGELESLLRVDADEWKQEIVDTARYFTKPGHKLPKALGYQLAELNRRLNRPDVFAEEPCATPLAAAH